ncbi:trihelix transcription factor ASIL2 [Brassica rapa]|uniref:trihelix transcription factor ASIL2 n=1 Tax=Brassica campestris TaxID=3711 RepID=UPI0004F16CC3|nr:trihelix transcription factor ASIL2 [Brassica rapa]
MKDAVNDSFSPGSSRPSPSMLSREDYWSEEATFTLIQAWGRRYVDLSRGGLRQKHWQEVANAVNDRHFNTGRNVSAAKSQPYRTDVQCKNRIDTLKKKYKVEKARVSSESYVSAWPFFSDLDELLRETFPATSSAGPDNSQRPSPSLPIVPVPVAPRSAISRRPAPAIMSLGGDNLLGFRGNLNAFAAAAAAAASPAYEDDSDGSRSRSSGGNNRKREREVEIEIEEKKGYKEVAEAIERFGKIYEKVEERKRKEMVELEKQRMRFAKELECHRMQLFTEMQVRLHKLRRSSGSNGPTSSANAALEYGMMDFPSYF